MNVLQKLRKASKEREKHWNPSGTPIPVSFRLIELAGEVGEVANAGKKLIRHDLGMVGGTPDMTNMREEIGDVLISLELVAQSYGLDLWDCVVEKFNKTSDKHGFPIKMDASGDIIQPPKQAHKGKNRTINFNGKVLVVDENDNVIGAQG